MASFKQSATRPHKLTAKRIAQIERWRTLGAQARRGSGRAKKSIHHARQGKRARGDGVVATYGKTTAWGVKKMVMPIGVGGPLVSMAKNRLPGYNQFQVVKASAHTANKGTTRKRPRKRR